MNEKTTPVRPKQKEKPKTVTEKFKRLETINPAVNELVKIFELQITP